MNYPYHKDYKIMKFSKAIEVGHRGPLILKHMTELMDVTTYFRDDYGDRLHANREDFSPTETFICYPVIKGHLTYRHYCTARGQ